MRLTEKNMIQNMQGKFSRFNKKLFSDFSKPHQRFIKDCSYGILSSQSCIVRQISQALHEKIDLKKTQERLTYHLNKLQLDKDISERLTSYQCSKLKKDSLILVDPSDIVKTKAQKMEGLSKVRDGNDGKWKNGYDVLDIVGVNKESNSLSLFPIHSQLHSNKIGVDTQKKGYLISWLILLFRPIIEVYLYLTEVLTTKKLSRSFTNMTLLILLE